MKSKGTIAAIVGGTLLLPILSVLGLVLGNSCILWIAVAVAPGDTERAGTIAALSAAVLAGIVFLVWSLPTLRGRLQLSRVSYVLAVVTGVASGLCLSWFWGVGMRYQGPGWLWLLTEANVVFFLSLLAMVWRNRRTPGVATALAFRFGLLVWVMSSAFPLLGEMP